MENITDEIAKAEVALVRATASWVLARKYSDDARTEMLALEASLRRLKEALHRESVNHPREAL